MQFIIKTINHSLNKAYLKEKVKRIDFDRFKFSFDVFVSKINENESEEQLKYPLRDFLKGTFYQEYEINTKGRTDLAIYSGTDTKAPVSVIFETKKPGSREFPDSNKPDTLNCKALHEVILYYLNERDVENNNDLSHIVITDLYEWYIFDAIDFERFINEKADSGISLKDEYKKWKSRQKTSKSTEFFYNEICKTLIEQIHKELTCTYFDIREYSKTERTTVLLYKIFSPAHLLKLPFANDSNMLNQQFYNELLHIIGLEEARQNGKIIIKRRTDYHNYPASILENTNTSIETENQLNNISNIEQYGKTPKEQSFTIALELSISWINRILFLKLLEAQLVRFNRNNNDFLFLNTEVIADFDELNELFFDVLAKKPHERKSYLQKKYEKIPYLNSSLFEISPLENQCIRINSLKSRFSLQLFEDTVLKNRTGQKATGKRNVLQYLFDFLAAYDFSGDSAGEIQEENKSLINASVLGLIFEKINGYKEGSFFTPGFITMYICRETLRRAVIQQFKKAGYTVSANEAFSKNIKELRDKIENPEEANNIINSLKICDPAVGSGHFLVSALNEIIAIKSDLKILRYRNGNRIKYYKIENENDDLTITDEENGEPFEYYLNPKNEIITERQQIQEAIFHEKQTIIENSLFGVDINPNSVNICRLRLWIELLKNAYYQSAEPQHDKNLQLQTLPNIDINIKKGNALVSRFRLDGNGMTNGQVQKMRMATQKYKQQVIIYKSTNDKKTKQNAEKEINRLKKQFAEIANPTDSDYVKLRKKQAELGSVPLVFTPEEKEHWLKKAELLTREVNELEETYQRKLHSLYGNSFEWRFEFPEVLDQNGTFTGFDAIIGNPPYYQIQYADFDFNAIKHLYAVFEARGDIYSLFVELGTKLLKPNGQLSFIVSNRFCNTNYGKTLRKYLSDFQINRMVKTNVDLFSKANVGTLIFVLTKKECTDNQTGIANLADSFDTKNFREIIEQNMIFVRQKHFTDKQWIFDNELALTIKNKMDKSGSPFAKQKDLKINRGITTGANSVFIVSKDKAEKWISKNPMYKEVLKPVLRGAEIKRFVVYNPHSYIILTKTGIDIENYPLVYRYLQKHKASLQNVYEAKKGQKKWYELRKCSYYSNFKKEKLIWARLSAKNAFAISDNGEYSIDTTTFATGKNLRYYCAILNSKIVYFYFKLGSVIWGKDGVMWFGEYFDNIPIPEANEKSQKKLEHLTTQIIDIKNNDIRSETSEIEKHIDEIVYNLYGLSKKEIAYIEKITKTE